MLIVHVCMYVCMYRVILLKSIVCMCMCQACFGGAGPQHCCAIAKSLGMKKVLVHRFSGILSAYGHTYIYTYIHTYIHITLIELVSCWTSIHLSIHIYMHTCIHTYIHTYIHDNLIYSLNRALSS